MSSRQQGGCVQRRRSVACTRTAVQHAVSRPSCTPKARAHLALCLYALARTAGASGVPVRVYAPRRGRHAYTSPNTGTEAVS